MSSKALNVFAGPNGSGKSTIYSQMNNNTSTSIYVNADDIESELISSACISFDKYEISITDVILKQYYEKSKQIIQERNETDLWELISLENNVLFIKENKNIKWSYLAGGIASLIRTQLLQNGFSFSFETVMSNPDKVQFMKHALNLGYKVRLFFIATNSPEVNTSRVSERVRLGGHDVPADTITRRYHKTMNNLYDAIKNSSKSMLFDNSYIESYLFAEIINGEKVEYEKNTVAPKWFHTYYLDKINKT